MKIYTYGDAIKPVMLLLPGTCCHHKTFDDVVALLQHFESPDIRRHDLQHEQLLVATPDLWLQEVEASTGVCTVEAPRAEHGL